MENRSVDIQRLTKPFKFGGKITSNPLSFGGGFKNGGLSENAMKLIAPIFAFDYMGAAEFEFGALPKALNKMIEKGNLEAFTLKVKTAEKGAAWEFEASGVCKDTVYVLCPGNWKEEVSKRITKFAKKETMDTRERVSLAESIRAKANEEEKPSIVGWIEINNGFMFFLDKEMWEQTCNIFGIDTDEM